MISGAFPIDDDPPPTRLALTLRRQVETTPGSGHWEAVTWAETVLPATVALLLCDVWDDHWCSAAARRVDALAPRIDAVVVAARALGVLIVHAPSDTLAFYADWPQRRRALALPAIEPPAPLVLPDPPLPIDDADGGCDSGEAPWRRAWSRQHPTIIIGPDDLIADDGRTVYAALAHHHRTVLCVAGVHTNMCVLNRSFGIKQMTRWGVRCLLLRDLTDAMYNPARSPLVSHDEGTALVIEHIERHWCPTLLGADLTRAAAGGRD